MTTKPGAQCHAGSAHNCWDRGAHFLAGFHAGYLEAVDYRAQTGRCLAADMDAHERSAVA
jgi:hypothetical protein